MEPYPIPSSSDNQRLIEILNEVKFVDKIIFGKLNYNVEVSNFQENKTFYQECADEVIRFCENRGMKYHIKYGTQKKDKKKTKKILKVSSQDLDIVYIKEPSLSI